MKIDAFGHALGPSLHIRYLDDAEVDKQSITHTVARSSRRPRIRPSRRRLIGD